MSFPPIFRLLHKRRSHLRDDVLNWLHPRTWQRSDPGRLPSLSRVLYINLDHREDRREHMERQFHWLGLPATRLAATRIASIEDFRASAGVHSGQRMARFLLENPNGPLGYLGGFLSHTKAIRSCPSDSGHTLICEDDLVVSRRSWLRWIASSLHLDFDVLLIDPQGDYLKRDRVTRNIYRVSEGAPVPWGEPSYWGLHAYLVRNGSRDKILQCLESCALDSPDHCLIDAHRILKVFALRTSLSRPKGSLGTDMRRKS